MTKSSAVHIAVFLLIIVCLMPQGIVGQSLEYKSDLGPRLGRKSQNARSSAGDLDTAFRPVLARYPASIRSSVVQADGKFVVAGSFISISGVARYNVARFNVDGTLDDSFAPRVADIVHSVALQPDGKIVIGGNFLRVNGVFRNRVARLNTDGSLDTTFNPVGLNNIAGFPIYEIALQSDGKILAAGGFAVVRIDPDGSVNSDGFSCTVVGNVYAIWPQPDGKILIGGNFVSVNGESRSFARLNANGTTDPSVTFSTTSIYEIVGQPDGKVLIGSAAVRIMRLNSDLQSLDAGFITGSGFNSEVRNINLLPDGKMIVGGFFTSYNGNPASRIARLNPDGTFDPTFSTGSGFDSFVYTSQIIAAGRIFVGGGFTQFNGSGRDSGTILDTSGAGVPSFSLSTTTQPVITAILSYPDGRMLVAGLFNRVDGDTVNSIVRFNLDGTVDKTFDSGTGTSSSVNALALDTSVAGPPKIVIGGNFISFNGVARNRIARLNSDGSMDTSFQPGSGANAVVRGILGFDGGLFIAGSFNSYNGTTRRGIAKLHSDGSLDQGFDPSTLLSNASFESLALDAQNRLVAGGFFNLGGSNRGVVRLNPDGSPDGTFIPPTVNGEASALALTVDDKIIVGGGFTEIGGTSQRGVARLLTNGALDTSFDVGEGIGTLDQVLEVVALPSKKVMVAGFLSSIDQMPVSNIARLDKDGGLDPSFTTTVDGTVYNIHIPTDTLNGTDRKAYISGDFFTVGGFAQAGIARLLIEPGLASLSGRVLQQNGRSITGASVSYTDEAGTVHAALTNKLGFYYFENIRTGMAITLSVSQRRFVFTQRQLEVVDNLTGVDFIAQP